MLKVHYPSKDYSEASEEETLVTACGRPYDKVDEAYYVSEDVFEVTCNNCKSAVNYRRAYFRAMGWEEEDE